MTRSINEIAKLATKVRHALRIERRSLLARNAERGVHAINTMLLDLSDEQLCRVHDIIMASDEVTDEQLAGREYDQHH